MFKLEKLPTNTLIDSKERGVFLKDEKGLWYDISPHCGDCVDCVSEEGEPNPMQYAPGVTVSEKAQDYFGEFAILAAPIGFVPEEETA